MTNIKISKTIKLPGVQTRKGRRNKFDYLPIEKLDVMESMRIKKIPVGYTKAQTEVSVIRKSIEKLCRERGITGSFVVAERSTPKRNEIRLWRTK